MADECNFCEIAGGERPAHVLYEDEQTIAFLDHQPAVRGHSLIVPKTHEVGVLTAAGETGLAVFETVQTVARALESTLEADGFSVFHTTGPLVGTIDHAHVHLVPRFTDDEVSLSLPRRGLDDDRAATLAEEVREKTD
ncbi:HIT family protein [Natrarchaeobaculum aegyptiacum]|uniref:HIT family protein n=1 Tax=Natrarchaeobaculum aegyptiacum TaxID=745377 RepID=A0A2Z2HTX8_9EURY|nr:HIT domain-containing protein [Natrarchaeobaculum aegyptiacum]ARS88887.1 HIT family protein [Natrarchaeobaculum aegyptiacum]